MATLASTVAHVHAHIEDQASVFSALYDRGEWGEGKNPGSTLESTTEYRSFLEQFIVEHGIRSVVDAGCGDWAFSSAIDWKGVRYLGLDIVSSVIERNRAQHPNVKFVTGDARRLDAY